MSVQLDGQLDLLDLLEIARGEQITGGANLTTKAPHPVNPGMRYVCPCCLTNWGELKPEVLERHRAEHEEVEPGICLHMHWIQGKLDALHRGEYGGMLVWTDDSKAEHLANVTRNRDLTWAHYNERSSPDGEGHTPIRTL